MFHTCSDGKLIPYSIHACINFHSHSLFISPLSLSLSLPPDDHTPTDELDNIPDLLQCQPVLPTAFHYGALHLPWCPLGLKVAHGVEKEEGLQVDPRAVVVKDIEGPASLLPTEHILQEAACHHLTHDTQVQLTTVIWQCTDQIDCDGVQQELWFRPRWHLQLSCANSWMSFSSVTSSWGWSMGILAMSNCPWETTACIISAAASSSYTSWHLLVIIFCMLFLFIIFLRLFVINIFLRLFLIIFLGLFLVIDFLKLLLISVFLKLLFGLTDHGCCPLQEDQVHLWRNDTRCCYQTCPDVHWTVFMDWVIILVYYMFKVGVKDGVIPLGCSWRLSA